MKTATILFLMVISAFQLLWAQFTIDDIYTDYNGWWVGSSSVAPDNSHNLLGFKIGTTVYSTGVDDAKLTTNGIIFNSLQFQALPTASGVAFQYIGVGYEYGGSGNITPVPVVNNPSLYLTDGIQGLDLGTALFNSTGTITYNTPSLDPLFIGDGIPDVLVTQVGSPPTTTDKFKFIDINGVTVGVEKSIVFSGVAKLGTAQWKFYDTTLNYNSSLAGPRDIRVIAYELSDFGINASNYTDIVSFVHVLSSNSDQSFVAYNKKTITVLPIELVNFSSSCDENIHLSWTTATEENVNHFEIYRSRDGSTWDFVSNIPAVGNSSISNSYSTNDEAIVETMYYKLRSVDNNGEFQEFLPISVMCQVEKSSWSLYPIPSSSKITLTIKATEKTTGILTLTDINGKLIRQKKISILTGVNSLPMDIRNLANGTYVFHLANETSKFQPIKFVKTN